MSFCYLDIVFSTDLSEDKNVKLKLKKALKGIEYVYFFNSFDNGVRYVIAKEKSKEILEAIQENNFKPIVRNQLDGTDRLLLVVKEITNDFADLDSKRIEGMFGTD